MDRDDTVEFTFSRHADEEIERRRIPREWVKSVLRNPEQRIVQARGKEIFQSRQRSTDGKLFLTRIIVNIERTPPIVVTVYRTSKIEKYWRTE